MSRPGVKTWNEALTVAGVSVGRRHSDRRVQSKDSEYIEFLVMLWHELGQPPTPKEDQDASRAGGLSGAQAATRRFGTWSGSVKAAGL